MQKGGMRVCGIDTGFDFHYDASDKLEQTQS